MLGCPPRPIQGMKHIRFCHHVQLGDGQAVHPATSPAQPAGGGGAQLPLRMGLNSGTELKS